MTSRGPFRPKTFYDSMIFPSKKNEVVMHSVADIGLLLPMYMYPCSSMQTSIILHCSLHLNVLKLHYSNRKLINIWVQNNLLRTSQFVNVNDYIKINKEQKNTFQYSCLQFGNQLRLHLSPEFQTLLD